MTDFVFRHLYNYILSLRSDLGISFSFPSFFILVLTWAEAGNLTTWLKMAIGNPRLLSQTDQESWQKKNISLRLWALPMKPSSSWAIRTANWQGSTAASTILRWGISETGRRWRKLRSGSIWNFSSTLLIRNMNGEWPVGATEPSACLSWWKTSLKQSWNKKWWKDEGAFFHQLFRRIESVAIFAPALARLGGLKKTLKEG